MKPIYRTLALVLTLVAFLAGCAAPPTDPSNAAQPTAAPALPPEDWPAQAWRAAPPEGLGMDSALLAQMLEQVQVSQLQIHSLLIVRRGYLVTEAYVYPYTPDQVHILASVTKSVVSALVGIAIDQDLIEGVHQSLSSLLPAEYAAGLDEAQQAITLEDLLTMTAGFDCQDTPPAGQPSLEASEDWVAFMLERPMAVEPGTRFNYCSGGAHLLSAILQKATGMTAREYANQVLFPAIGVAPVPEERWPADPQGITLGGYGLALTPQEMARFGYLYLRQGAWDDRQVVPAAWVAASTSSYIQKDDGKSYGYLWTIDPAGRYYAALGRSGQHIFVLPQQDLVVVFTAGLPFADSADLIPLLDLLDRYLLPAVKSGGPLPANPDGGARLDAILHKLAQPEAVAQPLSARAAEISGQPFTLEDNPFGWHTATFFFEARLARVRIDDQPELAIGLDGQYRFTGEPALYAGGYRGAWMDENTFQVEEISLGQPARYLYAIRFSGDQMTITSQNMVFEGEVEVRGTAGSRP